MLGSSFATFAADVGNHTFHEKTDETIETTEPDPLLTSEPAQHARGWKV